MSRVPSIEFLRGFAVSMVVVYHMYAVQIRYFGENQLPEIFKLGSWGVDIFFVISGVVMYKSVYGRDVDGSVLSFFFARVSRIYPAYWVITLVIFAISQLRPDLVNSSYEVTPSLVKSLLLLPDITNPWLNVGWSLIYEMWFYLILTFILLVRKHLGLLVLTVYGLFLIFTGGVYEEGPVIKMISDPIILEFIIGFAIGSVFFHVHLIRKQWLLFSIFIISAFIFLVIFSLRIDLSVNPLNRFLMFGLPAISLVAFLLYFNAHIARVLHFIPFVYIGSVSYSIYLTHVMVLNGFLLVVARVFVIGVPPIFANIFCFLLVIIAGVAYYKVVEYPLSKLLKQRFSKLVKGC